MNPSPRKMPPKKKKKKDDPIVPRRVNGALMDVHTAASFVGVTEKDIRGKVSRRLLPFRRLGGRIVFIRRELESYLSALDGCPLEEALMNMRERYDDRVSA